MNRTLYDLFREYPQKVDETTKDYVHRINGISKGYFSQGLSLKYIKTRLYSFRNGKSTSGANYVTTTRKKNGQGQTISTTEKLRVPLDEMIPKGHIIDRVSTNKTIGQQWIKTKLVNGGIDYNEIDKLTKKAWKGYTFTPITYKPTKKKGTYHMNVVYTDVHTAMETDATGYGLYGGVWNAVEQHKRKSRIIKEVKKVIAKKGKPSSIHVFDLGDFMDGWDGLTVRGGHTLPQNMDNEKAFDTAFDWKISLGQNLETTGVKVHHHNVCNDNHSGSFGYVVNKAVKIPIESTCKNTKWHIYRVFISHVKVGKHCFIFTHGKDAKHKKFGFKKDLTQEAIDKIQEYIDFHHLHDYYITFMKGDTHLECFDSSHPKINYFNYPALSPASEWVQTNFSRGRSGFVINTYSGSKEEIDTIPHRFSWKMKQGRE